MVQSTLTPDNITVVTASGKAGYQWVRQFVPNLAANFVTAWWVDPVSGNDEATGTTLGSPLKTFAEWNRRTFAITITGNVAVTVLNDVPDADQVYATANSQCFGVSFRTTISGTLTVASTQTVTTAQAKNATANQANELHIAGFDFTPFVGNLVRVQGTSNYAVVTKAISLGVGRVSELVTFTILSGVPIGTMTGGGGITTGQTVEFMAQTKGPLSVRNTGTAPVWLQDLRLTGTGFHRLYDASLSPVILTRVIFAGSTGGNLTTKAGSTYQCCSFQNGISSSPSSGMFNILGGAYLGPPTGSVFNLSAERFLLLTSFVLQYGQLQIPGSNLVIRGDIGQFDVPVTVSRAAGIWLADDLGPSSVYFTTDVGNAWRHALRQRKRGHLRLVHRPQLGRPVPLGCAAHLRRRERLRQRTDGPVREPAGSAQPVHRLGRDRQHGHARHPDPGRHRRQPVAPDGHGRSWARPHRDDSHCAYASATVRADGVAVGTIQLVSLASAALSDGTLCWVDSVGDYFRLAQGALTTTPLTVVTASGKAGYQWLRLNAPNPAAWSVTTWYVDPSGGNYENNGTSSITALKTFAEWDRRMVSGTGVSTTVNLLGDAPDGDAIVVSCDGTVTIQGAQTVVSTQTVTSSQDRVAASNLANEITVTGFNWTPFLNTLPARAGDAELRRDHQAGQQWPRALGRTVEHQQFGAGVEHGRGQRCGCGDGSHDQGTASDDRHRARINQRRRSRARWRRQRSLRQHENLEQRERGHSSAGHHRRHE